MLKLKITKLILFITLLHFQSTRGNNPVIRDIGMSDPHIRVFNDTVYLFCGHDNHPDDKTWVMKEWRVFSSTDLVNWTLEGIISPEDNYMEDESTDCWAGDAATRDGKYFFYFSDRKRGIGVMSSATPEGPYRDALGKPLVSPMHDPTILIDDDENETPYIIYGDKKGPYHIAKLNNDMISLAENPKPIEIKGKEWKNAPGWMDKNYIFKYNNTYYLSWGRDYAISDNIYGPYDCVGPVGNGHNLSEYAHGSFFWWKGQFYHIWCYYIRSGYKYRESIITYCHIDDNGNIKTDTDFLDKHYSNGVGQYNASWNSIQAEWYYEKSGELVKQECDEGGFEIAGIREGSWLKFPNMDFQGNLNKFTARIASEGQNAVVQIRRDSIEGPVLAELNVPSTRGANAYHTLQCDFTEISGVHEIYLTCTESHEKEIKLNWFSFSMDSHANKKKVSENPGLKIYPNPARSRMLIVRENPGNINQSLMIFNYQGVLVRKMEMNGHSFELNTTEWKKGMYFINLCQGDITLSDRFVIQ